MNENEYLAKNICKLLSDGAPAVLISVIGMQGSGPRHDGTKMVFGTGGKTYGTIGGSLIEAAAITEAGKTLSAGKSKVLFYELAGKDTSDPGMICGGKAEILLDFISPADENLAFFKQWVDLLQQGKDFYFLTHLKGTGKSLQVLGHMLLPSDGCTVGNNSLSGSELEALKPELHKVSSTEILPLKDTRVLVDRIRKIKTLYCFGAGHVAVPTAHIAALAGFRVIVLDDRADFASKERFPEANKAVVVEDYNRVFEKLDIDGDSYIVIVTRGHQYDRVVLEQSLKTPAEYIGMISSRRKRAAIYETLMAEGVKKERLDFVHSPIGIDIGGETPEEIAVSIVGELIKVRSEQQK